MVTNTEAKATAKQLWYLHILTKQDTREWLISMKEASDMITVLKGKQIEAKGISIPASAPIKELNAGANPITIISDVAEPVNTAIATMPVTLRDSTGHEITVNQSHFMAVATYIKELDGDKVPGYGVTNMPYVRRNFMFVYIDTTWRDWSINYASKLRNPNYQREIESQGIEVRQLCEVN
jgi:hypothetical protein